MVTKRGNVIFHEFSDLAKKRMKLNMIRRQHGKLTPEIVVKEAKDPNHLLHDDVYREPTKEDRDE